MIYAGLLNFHPSSISEERLIQAVGSVTQDPPSLLCKDTLVLCYGKLSTGQDMDKVWENDTSILIGRAFDKENVSALTEKGFKAFSYLSKESVLRKIWGKYIYININKIKSFFDIVIDSTGQLPFFYYVLSNGNILFASDIEIIFKVLSQKPEYNWTYLCSYLIYGNSSAIQTPFKDVFELPPACNLQITEKDRTSAPFWNPLNAYEEQEKQSKDIVNVLQKTLKAWIEPYQTVCVSLSGGLDSSSLVYCLKDLVRKDQTLTALNYYHSNIKSSNELIHARKVCEETGIELIEVDASQSLPFDSPQKKHSLESNKPFPGLVSQGWVETTLDNIPSSKSFVFLSGHGSDHIFMCPPSQKIVSDYVIEKGWKGYKEQLHNIADFYRAPFLSTLKKNIESIGAYFFYVRKNKRSLKNIIDEIPNWVAQEIRQKTSHNFIHPIYNHLLKRILPGKFDQIDALYEGIASIHMEIMTPADPTFYPFLYEPVVESALSFPTYDLFNKGYDRYPLRKAVHDHFKTETIWRRDKSQTTGIFQLGIKKNMDYVLDLCLEGQFVKQGLIDREELKKTIMLISNGDINHLWPFMQLASSEIFLRYWNEKFS